MRLIDADAAYERAQADSRRGALEDWGFDMIVNLLDSTPTVDAVPVVHGRWTHLGGDEWCCPVCGFVIATEGSWDKPAKKYCEDCGAKMDGGDPDGR